MFLSTTVISASLINGIDSNAPSLSLSLMTSVLSPSGPLVKTFLISSSSHISLPVTVTVSALNTIITDTASTIAIIITIRIAITPAFRFLFDLCKMYITSKHSYIFCDILISSAYISGVGYYSHSVCKKSCKYKRCPAPQIFCI